jgi:hypothetical protein
MGVSFQSYHAIWYFLASCFLGPSLHFERVSGAMKQHIPGGHGSFQRTVAMPRYFYSLNNPLLSGHRRQPFIYSRYCFVFLHDWRLYETSLHQIV